MLVDSWIWFGLLRRMDFYNVGDQYCLRFHEKNGKVREIPVRHDLSLAITDYLEHSGIQYAVPASSLCSGPRFESLGDLLRIP